MPEKYQELKKYDTPKKFDFGNVKVTSICTGYISTNNNFPEPVFVWLMQFKDSVFLIDAGLSPQVNSPDYFSGLSAGFFKSDFKFYLSKNNHLIQQLEQLSVKTSDIKTIFLTHAHFDHIGYLPQLKGIKVVLTVKESESVKTKGQLAGYQKNTEKIIDFSRIEVIDASQMKLKKYNSLISVLQTSNHTAGHEMILLNTDKGKVLFTGDIDLSKISKTNKLYRQIEKQVSIKDCVLLFNHGAL
ncbi:MAG: MBL fold metallo-hydrolase [Bacteroidetes bacterium]|nr:MBL fold metallo-hydrolase [Bacteroidota bacterium]